MGNLHKLAKNLSLLGFLNIATKVLAIPFTIYLARVLAPSEYGVLKFATVTLGYLLVITDMGVFQVGSRTVSTKKYKYEEIISAAIITKMLQAVPALLILVSVLIFADKSIEIKALLLLFSFIAFINIINTEWFFVGIQKMEYLVFSRLSNQILSLIGVILFVKSAAQIIYIPVVQIAGTIVSILILLYGLKKEIGTFKLRINKLIIKEVLKSSLLLGFSIIFVQVLYNFDVIILTIYQSSEEVGYYSAAYQMITLIVTPITILYQSVFPIMSSLYVESKERFKLLIGYISKITPAFAFAIPVFGVFAGGPLLTLMFGERYNGAIPMFNILVFSTVIIYMNNINHQTFIATGHDKEYFKATLYAATANVVLNFIFIPRYGTTAAAVNVIAAEGFCTLYSRWRFKKVLIEDSILPYFIKPLISTGILMIFFLLTPSFNIFIRSIAGVFIYVGALLLQGFIEVHELRLFFSLHPALKKLGIWLENKTGGRFTLENAKPEQETQQVNETNNT